MIISASDRFGNFAVITAARAHINTLTNWPFIRLSGSYLNSGTTIRHPAGTAVMLARTFSFFFFFFTSAGRHYTSSYLWTSRRVSGRVPPSRHPKMAATCNQSYACPSVRPYVSKSHVEFKACPVIQLIIKK